MHTSPPRPASKLRFGQRDRDIFTLAVPALGALIAEPLFLLVDTAMIGQLGAEQLAGVGIGTAVLHTVVGLLIFLAYATTPIVARRLGFGDRPGAIRAGIDGIWLAVAVGALLLPSFFSLRTSWRCSEQPRR
ncbi:MATE family efflux transporter [Humidisolicoccus flavus]|uniref:MATE family efflux transporter n=1 Tax=Humidisolicoccus flavus TaxID=3111414 RepID=UPI00324419CA